MGNGTMMAQVLKVLMVGLLYSCPLREWEGAASRPADHDPSASEGEYTDGREVGEGVGVGKRAVETFNNYDK